MSAAPQGNVPTSRRGGSSTSQTHAAAPSTAVDHSSHLPAGSQVSTQPSEYSPITRAEELAAVLTEVHGITADVHKLRSGNAILSVHYGLLAYTDGEKFWWTSPELSDSGSPLLSSALTLPVVAEQLARHYAILRGRDATDVLRSGLPLLADVIMADHVVPR
ncbi:hypothetical protein OG339_42820 [Streptosporangium sp. NBC_01495]|uniref:hypothetical protein n=1 Tax=Streptosporangium sp. NBC_01495 TaxID=2903899 RepID=UPI002E3182F3|nr:hypothetical protein [Streptosporangium sp. NBC_01495]